jgi:hypothetical protein
MDYYVIFKGQKVKVKRRQETLRYEGRRQEVDQEAEGRRQEGW